MDKPAQSSPISGGEGLVVKIDDKFPERVGDTACWEETSNRRVESSGGAICWVLTTGNVACDKSASVSRRDVMDAPEDPVGFPVSAPSLPPALDDAAVVTKDLEKLTWYARCTERSSEELEADGLCPPDVPTICLPPWDETPCSPLVADNNADTKT